MTHHVHAPKFTTDTFDAEVLNSEQPVLVDFYADWCGPCRMQGPIVDQLADDYAGRAKVGKVDIDAQGELAQRYGVRSIPTLLLFRGGEVVEQMVGAHSRRVLQKTLDRELDAAAAAE